MTFPRKVGLILVLIAVAAALSFHTGFALPSLRWFYSFGGTPGAFAATDWRAALGRWIGDAACGLMAVAGVVLIATGGGFRWNPLTLRKFRRFRSIGRGWIAFQLLVVMLVLALLDQALVGSKALAVKYQGKWSFPAFEKRLYYEKDFGGDATDPADFRKLKERFKAANGGDYVLLAPIPWDQVLDSDDVLSVPLEEKDGKLFAPGEKEAYRGQAVQFQPGSKDLLARSSRFRNGLQDGPASAYDSAGNFAGQEVWQEGVRLSSDAENLVDVPAGTPWIRQVFPPAPPSFKDRHFLGTDPKGWDIAAQLYGGLQVIFKASAFFLVLTYSAGIVMGCLMGYFGGWFDLVLQRVIEILSNIPFLLVVIFITSSLGRENVTLTKILLMYCVWSWIDVATYLRTSTFREKARDYVAAARVQGAGTARVIFRHILPNAMSTIVTLVPFTVASLTTSLTAMDFLGFGLPDSYPSWGRVLDDGTSNLSSVWIVSSVFGVMVTLLLLITFIGEAIREAFDPKKFTTYQ